MINLLPPTRKLVVYKDLLFRQIRLLIWLAVIIIAALAIFNLNSLIFLKIQAREVDRALSLENLNSETREAQELKQEVKGLNALLTRYSTLKSGQTGAVAALLELNKLVPSGVSLQVLSFDNASRRIIVSGVAASRGDIMVFESRLKESVLFEKLNSPLSNFLESANANFSFTFYFK
ncbi:MAG: PilN domain-containing protein [Parcubacteria group bacterium]|nr:PilN domain-containing protein [Parcubacteria group bacterium]